MQICFSEFKARATVKNPARFEAKGDASDSNLKAGQMAELSLIAGFTPFVFAVRRA
jgi:hypothetical protein